MSFMKIKIKTIGILLLISLLLIWLPIPFIDGRLIGSVMILVAAIYLILK